MLVAAIVGGAAILGVISAALSRKRAVRAALAGAGVVGWLFLLVYAVAIHRCSANSHCDTGFLWFFGLFALFGWLLGLLIGSVIGRRTRLR